MYHDIDMQFYPSMNKKGRLRNYAYWSQNSVHVIFSDYIVFNLTFDGLFSDLSFNGGGGGSKCPPPLFIWQNNRKSNKIMHCVEKKII